MTSGRLMTRRRRHRVARNCHVFGVLSGESRDRWMQYGVIRIDRVLSDEAAEEVRGRLAISMLAKEWQLSMAVARWHGRKRRGNETPRP